MSDLTGGAELNHPILNLTADEKRAFQYLFQQADTERLGVVTGEVAVKFFERTKLAPAILGEIWQIADTENCGFLTLPGFCQVLRLIGHYQAGRDPTQELAFRPAPIPKFEGLSIPAAPSITTAQPFPPPPPPTTLTPQLSGSIQPQMSGSGGPIRVPPLTPGKAVEYASLFEKSGAQNGILSGENAKQIFEKARLPNDVLGHIWNLADVEQRGALGVTEFIIAMHLLASYRNGVMKQLPNNLPPGLYEAAARRPPIPPPPGRPRPDEPSSAIPRQFSGVAPQRNQSPLARPPYGTPPQSVQATGNDWVINAQEKASYDGLFNKVDTMGRGFITGEQAVQFFSDSMLPEDVLAGIWDLADIKSEGQLNKDEFAVAMYLIRQQRKPGMTLPTTLPPNLVPPSMRVQGRGPPPVSPSMPEPTPFSAPPQAKSSAADDLFGLDAFAPTPAATQVQQSTGGSVPFNKPFEADPFSSKAASPTSPHPFQPAPRNPTATFKPFMPASSFGQTLTSQSTGQSGTSTQAKNQSSGIDDLLGDPNESEVNKKITQEATELANMSNQMSTLRTQMQEVQGKKQVSENDLKSVSTQKRDLELRLSQFKTQYEQEVKAVEALKDRLNTSKNETRKLAQELSIAEATYQDLQGQHRQVGSALEADQRENANLKERIRQINIEIGQLRPQLDKLRQDARQQKGMVAINKKQLVTNEGEREKVKGEINDLEKSAEEFRSPQATPSVVSPAASTASHSTNPFFRKSPQPTAETAMSPSGFSRDNAHKDFDNVFGNTFTSQQSTNPPAAFRQESQSQVPTFSAPSGPSVRSSEGPDVPTPSTSPPLSSYQESPRAGDLPAPPESRQFASAFLPLRDNLPRSDSIGSSVKVSAPASRYGGGPGNETPTMSKASVSATPVPEKPNVERSDTSKTETETFGSFPFDRNLSASPVASQTSDVQRTGPKAEERKDTLPTFPPVERDMPGAFPGAPSSPLQQMPTGESSMSNQSKTPSRATEGAQSARTDPFSTASGSQPRPGPKVDFDSAFAGFGGGSRKYSDSSAGVNGTAPSSKLHQEFPPIEDVAHDDESDSNSEQGFADNFTSSSPQQQRTSFGTNPQQPRPGTGVTSGETLNDDLYKAPPPTTRLDSNLGGLPSPGAQKSPPSYEQSVPARSSSNSFPPEFGGLLPSRTDPTSPPAAAAQSPEKPFSPTPAGSQGAALFGGPAGKPATTSPPPADTPSTVPSDAYHSAVSYGTTETNKGPSPPSNPPQLGKSVFNNDFDAGFDDLQDAKEDDDKTDDDFMMSSQHRGEFDEFNPVFDSPAASKANTMASQQTPTGRPLDNSFSDFDDLSQSFSQPKAQPTASSSHDWDAIFSNLESSQNEPATQHDPNDLSKSVFDTLDQEHPASSSKSPQNLNMPQLGRAISQGTEHDDPILKKLTAMGYARNDALSALEKYDYDINKAADHLTSGQ